MDEFDFLVVGTGSGLDVANAAVDRGQSVAVVEKGRIGGTCLNRGCIPSKQLLYHADVLETVERADEFHVDVTVEDVDFPAIVREVNDDVHGDSDAIRRGLKSSDRHSLYEGTAEFVGERELELVDGPDEGAHLRADTVLVAAGTRPAIPDVDGIEDVDYLTSTEALQLETVPDHLLVVGGGYIAAELGHFFGTFGSDATIVGRRPTLLPEADEAVAAAFTDRYRDRFTVHTGHAATAVSQDEDGEITVEAKPYEYDEGGGGEGGGGGDGGSLDEDADSVTATGDALLIAAGRRPNTDILDVEAAGVETDDEGFVVTDDYLRTTADDIWALGDVVGEYLLKHNANHEARTVARNLFSDDPAPVDYTAMPFAVFASPEVAGVGAREQDLRAAGEAYATRVYRYEDTARGHAMKTEGFVKAIVAPDGEILGCHVIGPEASNLVEEVVVAMKSGSGTVRDIRESVHVHPALSEVVQRAFTGQFTRGDSGHHHGDGEHRHHGDGGHRHE